MKKEPIIRTREDVIIYKDYASMPINPKYVDSILKRKKTSTIRDRIRILPPNCIIRLDYSDEKPALKIRIENYKIKLLKHVTVKEALIDGFRDKKEFLREFKNYYPGCNENTIVTIIKFKLIKG